MGINDGSMNIMTPQQHLKNLESNDHGFLDEKTNWSNHKAFLLLGLSLMTKCTRVSEYGSGLGSTPYIKGYCEAKGYEFETFDYNREWAEKTGAQYVSNWDMLHLRECGLAFIDLSPGEYRQTMLRRLTNIADIIVCHDTEIFGAGDYKWHFGAFQHQLHYNIMGGGAAASILSNRVDVSQYAGMELGNYKFDI